MTKITSTGHPALPARCVLDCVDSSVRIVSPTSGEVITTLLVAVDRVLVASAYAIAEGKLREPLKLISQSLLNARISFN